MDNELIVEEVNEEQYNKIVTEQCIAFCRTKFNSLNKGKVDILKYIIIKKDNSNRFALCLGIKDNIAKLPFSAPFGMIISLKKEAAIERIDEALESLIEYVNRIGCKKLKIVLPPLFYGNDEITAWINSMFRKKFQIAMVDINYSFDLKKVYSSDYDKKIYRNARKNLHIALNSNLLLHKCKYEEEYVEGYKVIHDNRTGRGFPLRMTCEEVISTMRIISSDFFLVKKDGINVAAALVYKITNEVAQVIYWGDRAGFSESKPINFLSYKLIQYYGEIGFRYLDIGPSTENSIPNYGLCDFKESIGCDRGLKFTMELTL